MDQVAFRVASKDWRFGDPASVVGEVREVQFYGTTVKVRIAFAKRYTDPVLGPGVWVTGTLIKEEGV